MTLTSTVDDGRMSTAPAAKDVPLSKLTPAPWNPRTLTDERFKNLCRSIEADPDFLWRRPILANQAGEIYGGNQRFRAVAHLGWATVPAIIEDVPERLAKERALKDNATWGEWNEQELSELLEQVRIDDGDVTLLGFDPVRLAELLGDVEPMGDTDGSMMFEEKWQILVECGDETRQRELLERFESEGLTCRALIA